MTAPFFSLEPLRRWGEDYGWIVLCSCIAAICFGGAWAMKVFLMNPEFALSGWSPLSVLWSIIWGILLIAGFYGLLGMCCTRFIDSFSDR